jgi:hypothetical protein
MEHINGLSYSRKYRELLDQLSTCPTHLISTDVWNLED